VATLDRNRVGRKFRRMLSAEIESILQASS